MTEIFTTVFYQPILNLLVFLYNIVPGNDIGIAIVLMTVIIKLALFPLSKKAIESQKSLADLQPKMDKIKKEYANNKEEMTKKMMALYAEHKINPFSSCLPLLIQFPFLIAVYYVFRNGLTNGSLDLVYPFINQPESINAFSMGFLDLSKSNIVLALMAGLGQFFQARMLVRKKPEVKSGGSQDEGMAAAMNKQMLYFMPVLTVIISMRLPSGLALYWLTTTIMTILQQKLVFKKMGGGKNNDDKDGQNKENKIIEGEVVQ